jgi:hypothetical protein
MAHWAKIDETNMVVDVLVAGDDSEQWLVERLGGVWKQTSYNTRGGVHYTDGQPSADQSKAFRGNYAGIGFTYDADLDAFIPPKPSEDATLDEATFSWIVPEPDEA